MPKTGISRNGWDARQDDPAAERTHRICGGEGARRIIDKDFHLKNPKVVQDAIDEYRGQNDWLGDFLEECCEVDPSYREKSGELYLEYRAYCTRMGEYARSTTDFYGALAQRDFERKKTKTGIVVLGLRIKSEFDG